MNAVEPLLDTPAQTPAPPAELDQLLQAERAHLQQVFPMPPTRAPRRKPVAQGGALAVALLAAGLWWADPSYRTEQFAAPLGPPQQFALADGSRLTLDSQSRADVRWHLRSRRVELHAGRGHFEVAHSAWRPFRVEAAGARVEVTGTVFDVDLAADAVEVALWQGRVQLTARDGSARPVTMAPGDRLRLTRQGAQSLLERLPAARPDERDWTRGQWVFQRTPLSQVVRELQRYRQAPIHVDGASAAALQLSGVFDSAQGERLLDLLPRALPVTLQRSPDGEVWIRSR